MTPCELANQPLQPTSGARAPSSNWQDRERRSRLSGHALGRLLPPT